MVAQHSRGVLGASTGRRIQGHELLGRGDLTKDGARQVYAGVDHDAIARQVAVRFGEHEVAGAAGFIQNGHVSYLALRRA
ncbi:hypothetical protein FQZ97_923820 [compost metagenome]